MFYLKLSLTGLLVLTFYGGFVSCSDDNINKQLTPHDSNEILNKTQLELAENVTNLRSGRTLLSHNRKPAFTLRRRQPIQIRSRADHFPIRTQIRRVHNNLPNVRPQQQNMRHGYESLKSSKYMAPAKGASLTFSNNGKGSPYRPQLFGGHPNSIHVPALSQQYMHNFKASPAFNGQVVVHPVGQAQQTNTAQQDNSYPKYVKPPQQQPQPTAVISPQQQKPALTKYPDFQQYPIPDHEKMQQHNEQHEKYLQQQQKFLAPKNPISYYQLPQHSQQRQHHQELSAQAQQNYAVQQQPVQYLPQLQQQQQPSIPIHESTQASTSHSINKVAFPAVASVPPKMYSVYEENDMTELPENNYPTATYQGVDKEAQEYLRFINTDEYFLPKKEPNYKRMDDETDKRQHNILKAHPQQHLHSLQKSQAPTPYQQPQLQQTIYQQPIYTASAVSQGTPYSNSLHSDASEAPAAYNQRLPVSRLFYQQDHSPSASGSASAPATVLHTSYQTGYNQNQFVINSQDKRSGKYTIPATSTISSIAISTQAPVQYPQLRYNAAANRTPEPLRFEFTERDAVISSFPYTNAPQGQLRYKELTSNGITPIVSAVESSTASNSVKAQNYLNGKHAIKPVVEVNEDDPEDGDDMSEAENDVFGRQPMTSISDSKANKLSSSTEAPPSEQKDTEEYCERICAIVEDENEEIVCGSDGYMYTSEAQMECYASCLHIDITIQGKGSCSK